MRYTYQGKPVEMPPKELELLYFLASPSRTRVFTREQLLEQVWGFDFFGDSPHGGRAHQAPARKAARQRAIRLADQARCGASAINSR